MSRKHKEERRARKSAAQAQKPAQGNPGILTRWRCAKRCGEGEWTPKMDLPKKCPACGAGIDIER